MRRAQGCAQPRDTAVPDQPDPRFSGAGAHKEGLRLAAKYRPQTVAEFCISPALAESLRAMASIDDLSIMFVGAPFSGKTALLTAIVREYYKIPRDAPIPETNVMFVNSLGDNGIGFYRIDLKTFCKSRSTIPGRKKTVVVDDIDALTEQSQHVFRNHIDKYGHCVNFVSACTNPQRVVASLQSRLHPVRLEKPAAAQVGALIRRVAETEAIEIDAGALELMLGFCDHSICAMLNYLEKARLLGIPVRCAPASPAGSASMRDVGVVELITDISNDEFRRYFELVRARALQEAIAVLYCMYDGGYSVIDILEYLFAFAKASAMLTDGEKYAVVEILCRYIAIFNTAHEDAVELALMTNNMLGALLPAPGAPLAQK